MQGMLSGLQQKVESSDKDWVGGIASEQERDTVPSREWQCVSST